MNRNGVNPANTENVYYAFDQEEACAVTAGSVSCDAMSELAIAETQRNAGVLSYQVAFPACERFQQLADRVQEYNLQKPPGLMRKMCFTKTDDFQQGPWETQFNQVPWQNVNFDKWTRAKANTK